MLRGASQMPGKKGGGKIVLYLLIIGTLGCNWDRRLPVGIHPKFVPSQTPTNHPYSFLNHIVNSVPKRKKGLWSIGKRNLNWKRNLLLKYWKLIRTLEVFEKVKVNVDICTTPNWTNPHFDEQNGCITQMGIDQHFKAGYVHLPCGSVQLVAQKPQ